MNTMDDTMRAVLAVMPWATFDTDNDGQVIVYTGLRLLGDRVAAFDSESEA